MNHLNNTALTDLSEQSRLDYLKTMGIQPWFPRVALVNAMDEALLYLPTGEPSEDVAVTPIAPTPIAPLLEPMAEPPVFIDDSATATPSASVEHVAKQAPTAIALAESTAVIELHEAACRFKLAIYTLAEQILCITDTPLQENEQLVADQRILLENMLYAVGVKVSHIDTVMLEWPLMPRAHFKQGWAEAQGMVSACMAPKLKAGKYQAVLVLGQQALQAILGKETDLESDHALITVEGVDIPVYATYSLTSLLKVPSLKAEAWAHIKPLRSLYLASK